MIVEVYRGREIRQIEKKGLTMFSIEGLKATSSNIEGLKDAFDKENDIQGLLISEHKKCYLFGRKMSSAHPFYVNFKSGGSYIHLLQVF